MCGQRPLAAKVTVRMRRVLVADRSIAKWLQASKYGEFCAPEGTRTPNLLIRSQVLYPLSYGRIVVPAGQSTGYRPVDLTTQRRLRDSNPGWALDPNRISSAAP